MEKEIEFVIEKVKFAMDNESCWNYFRAILKHNLLKNKKGKTQEQMLLVILMFDGIYINLYLF